MATSRSSCCHRLGSTVEGSRVPQLPVPGSGPEGPTQNSLTFNTASSRAWAQTPFAKEIFGQKSVANKNCCCCCFVIVVAIVHHCAARRVAPYLPASAAAADLAAFCCWCCNHVKCQFAFCAIRATLHKHSQSSI